MCRALMLAIDRPKRHTLAAALVPVAFAIAILAEAALAYLGLGTPTGQASWGRMLYEAQSTLRSAAHLALVPGGAIALSVLGFNLLGDGLRDHLDPKLEGR